MSKQHEALGTELKALESPAASQAVPETESPKVPTPTSALTPDMQAYTSAMITEAVKAVFASMAPMLSSIALTPEKLAEAERLRRAPDPAAIARALREHRLAAADLEEAERTKKANQNACPHQYPSGAATWHVIRNFPDRQARFSCPLCGIWIHPRQWVIGAPDAENPRGKAFIQNEHPLYREASKVLATKG
jgi:hypothetical protein